MAARLKLSLSLIATGKTDAIEESYLVTSAIIKWIIPSPVWRQPICFVDGYRGFAVYMMMVNLSGSSETAATSITKRS
jgi:hypothetical protein